MNVAQRTPAFHHSIYRDFALIALAAFGVGLAVSLTLATAIVLATPSPKATVSDARKTAPQGFYKTRLALTPNAARDLI